VLSAVVLSLDRALAVILDKHLGRAYNVHKFEFGSLIPPFPVRVVLAVRSQRSTRHATVTEKSSTFHLSFSMFLYLGTKDNRITAIEIDCDTGNCIREVEDVNPVVEAIPEGVPTTGTNKPVTEWILMHPRFDLLYVFTSFHTSHVAQVTTFRVDPLLGSLTRLGASVSTGGLHPAHATVSPDGSTLAVAHYGDGKLSFFDCSKDKALADPLKVLDTLEVKPETRYTKLPNPLPSLHHVAYAPNGKYLVTSDCSAQSRLWTYEVDGKGRLTSGAPMYRHKVSAMCRFPGAVAGLLSRMLDAPCRIRRTSFHPSGKYCYVLLESHNVIQVYEVKEEGKIIPDCLQELPTLDPDFHRHAYKGAAVNMAGEMMATDTGVWVSNRGMRASEWLGQVENSLRFFRYQENSGLLDPASTAIPTSGPVRHFLMGKDSQYILAGVSKEEPAVELFRTSGQHTWIGEASTGMDIVGMAARGWK